MKKNLWGAIIMLSKYFVIGFLVQLVVFSTLLGKSVEAQLTNPVHANLRDVSVKQVFDILKKSANVTFVYDTRDVNSAQRISIGSHKLNAAEVLNELASRLDLSYKKIGNTITLKKKAVSDKPAALPYLPSPAISLKDKAFTTAARLTYVFTISGTVTDSSGNPLIGVSVQIKGTNRGTVTDASGHYEIEAPEDATLVFSYVGYQGKEVPVNGRETIDITLRPDVSELNQVVVIGYGSRERKDLTGAISSLNVEQLQNENPTSVQEALRANLPGLNVGFSTGAKPGGNLQIRGINSLSAGTSPLIVVDGVIYYGALSDINPMDIATIDVLKGASAAAVYGAKSANGVIAITTKKGKPGKPVINFNANLSLVTMEVNQPVYQGEDFVNWRTDVFRSANGFNEEPYEFNDPRKLPPDISIDEWLAYDGSSGDPVEIWLNRLNFNPIEITDYKKGAVTNWYDLVFHNGIQQNYTLSLSGASDNFNYYWSGGYLNNESLIVGDKYSTIRSRLKIEGKVTKFLTVGVNTAFAVRDESSVPVSWNLIRYNSPYGSMWNDDTTDYRFSPQDDAGGGSRNPFYGPKYTDRRRKYYTLNSIIYGKITLPFGITYRVNFTPEFEWYQYFNHNSSESQQYALLGGTAKRDQHQIYQWQIDNILSWKKTFHRDHHIELTLLANAEKYQYWQNDMQTNGFDPSDVLGYHNFAAGSNPAISTDDEYSTGAALMGRLFYSYKDRYLLTMSIRRDGYSAFGQKYPWATFPAIAGGWIFTEEPFFKSNWLNYGKLRLSYGKNGNRSIGRYSALADLTTGKYLEISPDGTVNVVSMLYVNRMQNQELKWEGTKSFNIGLDFRLFNGVLSGSVDAYKSKTTGLLVNRSLPDLTGFTDITTNLGEVDNKGLEISLNSRNISRPSFSWNTSFNFSLNRNKIVHLYGNMIDIVDSTGKVTGQKETDDISNGWFIGHAINAVWDARVLGVYQSDEADEAAKYGKSPGDFKVQDVNGDGKITDADRQFLGHSRPRFRWGVTNHFTLYKNFDIAFSIYSYWGNKAKFNVAKNYISSGRPDRTNYYVLPYWTPEHPENKYARMYSTDGGASYSIYRNLSFIRLQNISLGYTFSKRLLQKVSIRNLKVYFTVKNVAFYMPDQDYQFWDPEHNGPTPRTYTLGINLTL